MKDLKHLIFFEDLLQEANNKLVQQAQAEGNVCVAYICENTPEPLLNLPGTFSARLRAPRTGSFDIATYYLTSFLCEYSRALLERAIEGGYNFADCIITPDGCSMMNRCVENMELLKAVGKDKENFFYQYMEIPMKADDNGLNLYVLQCKNHILNPLAEKFGTEGDGKSAGIKTDDEECGPLTCNVGLLRFDGVKLEVTLDIRWPLATNEEKILGQMCMALSDTPLAVRRRGGHGVHYVPKEHKVVKGLLEVYHDITGLPAYPIAIGGGTYSRMMPNTVAFGVCFPGDMDVCHIADEYIDIEKMMLGVKIFAHAIAELAGAKD